jgi:hypothetical protein
MKRNQKLSHKEFAELLRYLELALQYEEIELNYQLQKHKENGKCKHPN